MSKNENKKSRVIAIFLVLTLIIGIGYAALTTNLSINGTAILKKQTWSVYFDNVQVKAGSVSGAKIITAPTTSGTTTTDLTWEVSMDTPGEYYEYNVDVVNGGTIDAMVETATNMIVSSALTEAQAKYLDYSIKYVNGAEIEQYDKLAAGERKTITVKLLFKNDESVNPEDLPTTAQSGISLSYSTNYVQADNRAVTKVTEIASLEIGDTVNYTTTLNGQTLNNWKVFYVDGDYTYIILDDYLPNAAVSNTIQTTYNLGLDGTYSIFANSREDLLNTMTTKEIWDDLLTGTINGNAVNETRTDNVWAMGSPTLDLWVNSWNASYPSDKLYTRYIDTEDIDYDNFYGTGYAIGDTENPPTTGVTLSSKTGYGNTLYFPHQDIVDYCQGNWLASPSAESDGNIMFADFEGRVYNNYYVSFDEYAFRPVICLPSSVVSQ